MSKQPIEFLLHQLATNEQQDRVMFNKNIYGIECELIEEELYFRQRPLEVVFDDDFNRFNILMQIEIIRICLSCVNDEAVLGVFKGEITINYFNGGIDRYEQISDLLYLTFDYPLRNGKHLDEAIQALHEKMLELVPEYQEFLKNNN